MHITVLQDLNKPTPWSFIIKAVRPGQVASGRLPQQQLRHVTGVVLPEKQAQMQGSVGSTVDYWPAEGVLAFDAKSGEAAVLLLDEFMEYRQQGSRRRTRVTYAK